MEKRVNILMALNIVLLVSVAILFYLQFNPSVQPSSEPVTEMIPVQEEKSKVEDVTTPELQSGLNIAYIRSDEMLMQLNIVKTLQQQLKFQETKYEEDLGKKLKEVEDKAKVLEGQIQRNELSVNIAKIKENELVKEQQALIELRDRYTQQLGYQEMQVNQIIIDSIQNFLKRYNKNSKYDIVVNNVTGNDFLFVDSSFDITAEITEAMNAEYKR